MKWVPSEKITERAVLHFVRWKRGLPVVRAAKIDTGLAETVKGFVPKDEFGNDMVQENFGGSRPTLTLSAASFPKHAELTNPEYTNLLTLQKKEQFVLDVLGSDFEHIFREDTDRFYKMPRHAANRLPMKYKRIAIECDFREQVYSDEKTNKTKVVKCRVTPEVTKAIANTGMTPSEFFRRSIALGLVALNAETESD